jgi:hypothetical protein
MVEPEIVVRPVSERKYNPPPLPNSKLSEFDVFPEIVELVMLLSR